VKCSSVTDNSQGNGAVDEDSEGAFAHQAALLQDAREGIVDFFNLMFGRSQVSFIWATHFYLFFLLAPFHSHWMHFVFISISSAGRRFVLVVLTEQAVAA
jgi:hypothetical protein